MVRKADEGWISEGWAMSHPPLAVFVRLPYGHILDYLGIQDNGGSYSEGILEHVRYLRWIMRDSRRQWIVDGNVTDLDYERDPWTFPIRSPR